MSNKKTLNEEELYKVNGGTNGSGFKTVCPECKERFDPDVNYVTQGEGCDKERYKKCPNCGYVYK